MLERLIFVAILTLVGVTLYLWYTRRQMATIAANRHIDPILQGLNPGVPAIVYFTTPMCIPCKTRQLPALDKLKTDLGENIQIIQIDATEYPEVADRWGVLSAPTTFVINSNGTANAVNHGVADERKLKRQLMQAVS